ncbi:cap binding protein [Ophiostoma piceae UAMH 11346]|uniref:Cap binding protein n=1 Tax=Ophiostoma piceae (strain UAMH 11346) TaxID=1262450 RepID=S3C9N4_OPHP1|nr:cap binding protein [Ophiostoma piceae UAMH 11346]
MADYGRRGGYNNYSNGNNRKRRYNDDEGDYRQQRRRQEVPAPVQIRRRLLTLAESPVRQWYEEVVEIARLVANNDDGDSPDAPAADIPDNDNNNDNGDRNDHKPSGRPAGVVRKEFVDLVCQLIREQPLKTPFVAAVLLVLNALKPEIVLEVLQAIATATEHGIAAGLWRDVKLQLRLIACLQTCLAGDGVFPLLDTLFSRAVDLQTASSDDVVGTELVKIILLTIPYAMATTSASADFDKWRQQAADLMEKTEVIASEPHALQSLMDPFLHGLQQGNKKKLKKNYKAAKAASGEVGDDDDEDYTPDFDEDMEDGEDEASQNNGPPPAESLIALLQKQLQAEAANGWPLSCLPRITKLPLDEVELQAKLDDPSTTKHTLPAIAVPATVITGPRPLFPEVYFSVYGAWVDENDSTNNSATAATFLPHSVPPLTDVASSLVRDILMDTINGLDFNRNATAKFLIDIDCYFADGTFVKRATPFDRLRDVDPGKPTWKPEDVAVDTVFAQLFQLPQPEHKLVYYHSVLAETCKIAPAAIAPSLGRAIRFLYRNSPRMDLELVGRFVDWFAHHLSNFGFTWKWTEWVDDVQLPNLHPHKALILGAIDKEIRLSFAQRIKKTLPVPYQSLVNPNTELDVPPFKFAEKRRKAGDDELSSTDESPFAVDGRELAALLKRKAPEEEIQAVIERIHSQALDIGGLDPLVTSTDVFTTAVLWVGSKSLSHVLAAIERTKDRLLDAGAASEAARAQILDAVMDFWAAHPGVAVSIAEKLLNYAILTPAVIVQWALKDPEASSPSSSSSSSSPAPLSSPNLAVNYVAELVFNTVDKVTRRVHQLVASKHASVAAVATASDALDAAKERQRNPPPPVLPAAAAADANLDVAMDEEDNGASAANALAEAALAQAHADVEAARAAEEAETKAMRDLFKMLNEALQPWLTSSAGSGTSFAATFSTSTSPDNDGEEEAKETKAWAERWQRVVQRRAAVEEAFLRGEAKQ